MGECRKLDQARKERISLVRLPDLPYLELYQGYQVARSFPRHVHFLFSLGVQEEGERTSRINGSSHRSGPGSVTVVCPGEIHDHAAKEHPCTSKAIRLEARQLNQLIAQFGNFAQTGFRFDSPVIEDANLAERVLKLHRLLGRPETQLAKESYLLETLHYLFTRYAKDKPLAFIPPSKTAMLVARDYLHEHYFENVTLDGLAQLASLSPFHFVRIFSREIGVPPHTYLTQVRLNHALRLLGQGSPLIEVAQETGFYDQSHFCKAFKNKFGVTPSEYQG